MNRTTLAIIVIMLVSLSGCVTLRETQPSHTAREQLLLSTAADHATAQIAPNVPAGNSIYVDTGNFGSGGDYQSNYAITAVKSALLRRGYALAPSADKADTVLIISSGALSIDETDKLLGFPSGKIPIPFAGDLSTPEVAFWKSKERTGVAKFLLTYYDAKTGKLQDAAKPIYGFSNFNRSSIFFYGYTKSDLLPEDADEQDPPLRVVPGRASANNGSADTSTPGVQPRFADRLSVPN